MSVAAIEGGKKMPSQEAEKLHRDAIVIDGCCPLLVGKEYVDWYIEGGVTVVTPTVGGFYPPIVSFAFIGEWLEYIRTRDDLILVESAADVRRAKKEGKVGVVLHFQGSDQIEDNLNYINAFKKMGVGIMQLTYNVENRVGFGAQEKTDHGLKPFGVDVVRRCNETRVIVDCSHTGYRTTMDAIEVSEQPVIFSHANPFAVYATETSRNITDDQIRAIAATGGLVGVTGFPGFLSTESRPTLDKFIEHIDHLVEVGGIDHVALGIDYYLGQHPVADPEIAKMNYEHEVSEGRWRGLDYPPPPHYYPEGIETPRTLPVLTEGLLNRGYSAEDVRKIMGLNLVRVYEAVWGR